MMSINLNRKDGCSAYVGELKRCGNIIQGLRHQHFPNARLHCCVLCFSGEQSANLGILAGIKGLHRVVC
jgi:hypothetical protein